MTVTTDTLDRIEAWAKSFDAECAMEEEGVICFQRVEDREHAAAVLALVQVARAAQELVDAWYGDPNSTNLRDALARLDAT